MTALLRRRSVIALVCCLLTLALAFYGIIAGISRAFEVNGTGGFVSFIHYTMVSNLLAAVSAAFVFPFAVEGIRKKRFTLPGWTAVMHFVSAVSVTVMMIYAFAFAGWSPSGNAFVGHNLYLHIICPALILISFFQMESGHIYTMRDRLFGCVPLGLYVIVYLTEVFLIGEANGGWPDVYHVREHTAPALAAPASLLFGFCVSMLIAAVSNRLTRKRKKALFQHWKEGMNPVEVRIEAFGLGRMAGLTGEKDSIQVPFDILEQLADQYGMDPDELSRIYVGGLRSGLTERKR